MSLGSDRRRSMRREIVTIALMDLTELTRSPTGDRRMTFRGNKTLKNSLEMNENLLRREMIGDVKIAISASQGIRIHKRWTRVLKMTTYLRTHTSQHNNP
jgi:hypothetical protein